MDISDSYSFSAPAEVVFSVMTDPHRAARWMPPDVTIESVGVDHLHIRTGQGVQRYQIAMAPTDLHLRWQALDAPPLHGTVSVVDAPAGSSRLYVVVTVPEGGSDRAATDEELIRAFLVKAVRGLGSEVNDNFNPG